MTDACDAIELTVPAAEGHARLVRLVAAAAARECGFSVDCIDDVKLAIGEAFLLGVAVSESDEPLTMTIRTTPGTLRVRVSGLELGGEIDGLVEESRLGRYGLFVLGLIADEVKFETSDGRVDLDMEISCPGASA